MHAEIIAIGSELTSGAKLDTNSQWLSLQLAELGIPVRFHTTVADDLQANIDVLRIAAQRADLVLITGGLGPTLDDLTRDALAALADVELVLHPPSLEQIEDFFRHRGREMPQRNKVQALFPAGAEPLPNPIGTAPGIWMTLPLIDSGQAERQVTSPAPAGPLSLSPLRTTGVPHATILAALPGVPSEMHKMFLEQVRPRLPGGEMVIRRARLNCFGLGESHTEELLGELTARGHDPEIGITAHDATITLRINAQGRDEAECRRKIDAAAAEIRDRLGDYVYGVEDEGLEHVVVRELIVQRRTFATVEAGTGGLLAHWIAQVADARHCYAGGKVLMHCGEDLIALGRQQREELGTDYVLVVGTEEIETDPGGHVISTIPIALVGESAQQVLPLTWSGNPAITRNRAAKTALDLLRRHLG